MPELDRGFIPFSYVSSDTKYCDEVGNDYNPHGWNTATALFYTNGSITADGKTVNVIKPAVDTKVNHDGLVSGVWNKIETGEGTGSAIPPSVKPITFSTDSVIDKDHTEIKDFKATVQIDEGSESLESIKFEVIAGDTVLITQTVQDPTPGTIEFTIDDATMKQIEESGVIDVTMKVTASDGTQTSTSEKNMEFVHQMIFGVSNEKNPALVPAIIESTTDIVKIQKRTISYDLGLTTVSPFYPSGDWAYMYIAIPKEWGKVNSISAGAIYEISTEEWYPYACKINDIDYNLYVMQYNNEGTFEFLINVVKDE